MSWSAALLALGALLFAAAWKTRRTNVRLVLINVAAACIALAAFEGYLYYREKAGDGTRMEGTITEDFTHRDDVLGYRPNRGSRVTARKRYGDIVIYDVVYSIGADGLRVTPPPRANPPARCVVFFGDSNTFGEGVNDGEAYPYLVGEKGRGEIAVSNFAFSGYGPHQMLAALQANLLEPIVKCRQARFVHLAILEHIPRVAGRASWDRHGPRFRLDEKGTPVRDGNFDTPRVPGGRAMPEWVGKAAGEFRIGRLVSGRDRAPDAADLALYLAIVRESARVVRERYPGSTFDVVLWDGRDDARLGTIERALQSDEIGVHRLTRIIPDLNRSPDSYLLGPHDGHPNSVMHRLIAEYVSTAIVGPARLQ